jgi:hypothetical protein
MYRRDELQNLLHIQMDLAIHGEVNMCHQENFVPWFVHSHLKFQVIVFES